jgi:hypothetical protein
VPEPRPREPERFTVDLVALPDEVPAVVRLRAFLKRALRSYRLKCVRVVESRIAPPGGHHVAPRDP